MVDDFIERHHGHKAVRYLVPEMKEILNNTYGIIVYQEQIMQLAQKLAGYSLGDADLMRRAMGKKKREEMALHEKKFVSGAVARNIKKEKAEQIFSLMAQFADYGFNRSHSVAYAYLAFQTAYLKAHYPEHFYAAVLSNEIEDTAKVFKYSNELRGQGIELLPPDVNESGGGFTPLKGAIRYGLAAIKGVGQSSVEAILEARTAGPFMSLFDFAERVGQRAINKRVLESLVCAGAFDSLNPDGQHGRHVWRAALFAAVDTALTRGARAQHDKLSGQSGLFATADATAVGAPEPLPVVEPWTNVALLLGEKNSIGFYITGHPLENYVEVLTELKCVNSLNLHSFEPGSIARMGGIVTALQERTTKKGDRFALLRLEDQVGGLKCVVWPEAFNKYKHLLVDDAAVLVSGKLDSGDEGGASIIADEIVSLEDVLQKRARAVLLRLPMDKTPEAVLDALFKVLDHYRGDCDVLIEMYLRGGVLVRTRAHGALRVEGSLEMEAAVRELGFSVEWFSGERLRADVGA